jgi:hypothetical protein
MMDTIADYLFPRQAKALRRRELKRVAVAIVLGLLASLLMVALLLLMNWQRHS